MACRMSAKSVTAWHQHQQATEVKNGGDAQQIRGCSFVGRNCRVSAAVSGSCELPDLRARSFLNSANTIHFRNDRNYSGRKPSATRQQPECFGLPAENAEDLCWRRNSYRFSRHQQLYRSGLAQPAWRRNLLCEEVNRAIQCRKLGAQ
jgi:hypothetical protein